MAGADRQSLMVDFYELTMVAAYHHHGISQTATFELFVRGLPPERSFLIAAGIESALDYLETLRFTDDGIEFLRSQPGFRTVQSSFFDYLKTFRFTGEVHAVPEGTVVFAQEPLLRVTAPISEAQIVETYLLSVLHVETLIASKAARVVEAARGRKVLEFGTRRAHGPEAGVRAAKAAYLGGCSATSNVLAGQMYGVPLAGTAAHSWTMIFPSERESFERLLEVFPETAILLVDTYDALEGAATAASLGRKVMGVRLDSGDLGNDSKQVRALLDRRGLKDTKIIASGDLNEFKIKALLDEGAPIDVFGVGTDLATSRDAPALGMVYKLVETNEDGKAEFKAKFSDGKVNFPGRKQVFRFSRNGMFTHDVLACDGESFPEAEPLLEPVLRGGKRLGPRPSITERRERVRSGLSKLPEIHKRLEPAEAYPVRPSPSLERRLEELRERHISPPAGKSAR